MDSTVVESSIITKQDTTENYRKYKSYSLQGDELLSIAKHPKIAASTKIWVPSLVILNIGMFVYTSISNGASVSFRYSLLNMHAEPIPISYFSIYGSAQQMAQAGVWACAIIIPLMSSIWPFIKLIAMLFSWFLPQNKLSYSSREKILKWLNALGKWSFVDSFFMFMATVGFQFVKSFKYKKFEFSIDITVTPLLDFYIFASATILSLIITHKMVLEHRKTLEQDVSQIPEIQEALKIKFSLKEQKDNIYYAKLVPYLIIITMGFHLSGFFTSCFTFHFSGLAGWVLGNENNIPFSMWDLGYLLPLKTYFPNALQIRLLQALFFFLTLITPIIFLSILMVFYTTSLQLKTQKKLFTWAEILYAWSSIDVFVLVIISSMFQLGQFASFMIGDKCSGIDQTLKLVLELYPDLINIHGHKTCYHLETSLNFGYGLLIVASACFFFLGFFTLKNIQQSLNQRLEDIGERRVSFAVIQEQQEDFEIIESDNSSCIQKQLIENQQQ